MTADSVSVVIADDDPDIRALVAIAVRRAGFTLVSEHGDGASAWDAIRQHEPRLIVLDVSMPGLTGLEVAQAVRSETMLAQTRIVLLSAGADPVAQARGIEAGADRYLTKPFSPRQLAEQLQEVLS